MLKQRTSRLSLVCADLEPYLASMPPGAFTAFNLSDVFEYMPAAAAARTIGALIRVAGRGARIGFWTLFVPPPLPAAQGVLQPEADDTGFRRSRTFFYSGFHVWRVAGGNALTAAA
jgi:S-adenosylmethionine:diacylglycerol 3-amino-3-carboxypropyl transferase